MLRPAMGIRYSWVCGGIFLLGAILVFMGMAHHPSLSDSFSLRAIQDLSSSALNYGTPVTTCSAFLPALRPTYDRCQEFPPAAIGANFTARICYASSQCNSFEVYIQRSAETCSQQLQISSVADLISKHPDYTARVETMGADSFLLRTSGSERYGDEDAEFLGDCTYRFQVALANRGSFFLEVFWIHGDFWAFRENDPDGEIVMRRREPIFSRPVQLDICDDACPTTYSAPINATTISSHPSPLQQLPNCYADEPAPGVYVPVNKFDADYFPVKINEDQIRIVNQYKFQPRYCEWRHAGLKFADHARCFERQRRISVYGDSHARGIYDGMVHRFDGSIEFFRNSDKDSNKNRTFGDLTLSFVWDTYGDRLLKADCSEFLEADVFILGIGTWMAWDRRPMSSYGERLAQIIDHIGTCLGPAIEQKTLIYETAPVLPPRTFSHWSDSHDRRTNRRFYWWGELATKLFREAGWLVVDYLRISQPFALEPLSTDSKHYYRTDAHDALIDEMIGRSGVCDYS